MINCFAGRSQLQGDIYSSLHILHLVKNRYPDSSITWPIADKCKIAAQFLYSHPLIDNVIISKDTEGNEYEIEGKIYNQKNGLPGFDFSIDCNPLVHDSRWFEHSNIVKTNSLMAGFKEEEYNNLTDEEKIPRLYRNFEIDKTFCDDAPVIAIQTVAGYGQDGRRSPSIEWWQQLIKTCDNRYDFIQIGHPKDTKLEGIIDLTNDPFNKQIEYALGAQLCIGLENGLSWLINCYHEIPVLVLLSNWFGGTTNISKTAWCPVGDKIHNIWANSIHDISIEEVKNNIDKILN